MWSNVGSTMWGSKSSTFTPASAAGGARPAASPEPDGASARRAQLSHRARKGGDPAAVLLHDAPQKGHAPRLVQQLDRDEQRRPRTSARHELNREIDRDRSLARNLAVQEQRQEKRQFADGRKIAAVQATQRSEEHTSELQSLMRNSYA